MSFPQHFIIEGDFLGSSPREPQLIHGIYMKPFSYAYFCPVCAEIWARCPIEDRPFTVWTLPCRGHTTGHYQVPGSLTLSWDNDFNLAFPPRVVEWECDRHLEYFEGVEA